MAQRLVLRAEQEMSLSDLKKFVTRAETSGGKSTSVVKIAASSDDSVRLMFDIPNGVTALNDRAVVAKPKRRREQEVEKQINEHNEKKAEGKKQAYVPPVGRKTAPKPKKTKCPICNIKKPVVTQGGIKVLRFHVTKGEPCEGSGTQVVDGKALINHGKVE